MPVVQGQARARRFFDLIAPRYDAINAFLYRPEWRALVRSAILPGRVLDVGVGTGFTTGDLPEAVGIDLSREMASRAKGYRGSLVLADAMSPPFRTSSFTTVVCAGSFYYLPDPVAALRGFHRLLADGGRVVMLSAEAWFFRPLVRISTRRDFEAMAGETGFSLERYEGLRGIACFVTLRKRSGPPA